MLDGQCVMRLSVRKDPLWRREKVITIVPEQLFEEQERFHINVCQITVQHISRSRVNKELTAFHTVLFMQKLQNCTAKDSIDLPFALHSVRDRAQTRDWFGTLLNSCGTSIVCIYSFLFHET